MLTATLPVALMSHDNAYMILILGVASNKCVKLSNVDLSTDRQTDVHTDIFVVITRPSSTNTTMPKCKTAIV